MPDDTPSAPAACEPYRADPAASAGAPSRNVSHASAERQGWLGQGAIVALVGPDAAGKTTIARRLVESLGGPAAVPYVHFNTPPRTLLTRGLRTLYRAARWVRRHRIDSAPDTLGAEGVLLPACLAVIDAMERTACARRCASMAARGAVVVTDRYPTAEEGAATGPRVPSGAANGLARWLTGVERRMYQRTRPPDVVIRIQVPEEECVRRNAERPNPKPEAIIRQSHLEAGRIRFPSVTEYVVDNTRPLSDVHRELESFVREMLARSAATVASRGSPSAITVPALRQPEP